MDMHTLTIDGMMCANCVRHVTKALTGLEGVSAEVDLERGTAKVTHPQNVTVDALKAAVEEAGYTVTGIQEGNE